MHSKMVRLLFGICLPAVALTGSAMAAAPRPKALGVPFAGTSGQLDAITDVAGVEVGQVTLNEDRKQNDQSTTVLRTGVTVVHPLGKAGTDAVAAGFSVINGTGEFTGTRMVDETGLLIGPVALTGTANIPTVSQSFMDWALRPNYLPKELSFYHFLPVVGETLDARLTDITAHALSEHDVFKALDNAKGGPVEEGNVGGGTGMQAYGFKGGIGTASRVVTVNGTKYTVGVLLQANNGTRRDLRIAGIPVMEEVPDMMPERRGSAETGTSPSKNSLLMVIATDAPLQAHQLQRMARRAALGVGRDGSTAGSMSGEFALAFSTTNTSPLNGSPAPARQAISDLDTVRLDALFEATVQAVEEAIVNQLFASETMTGVNGYKVYGLPRDRVLALLKKHGRLAQ